MVVSLGEAGPESIVRVEKAYLNWDDFRIPDNAGNTPRDQAIASDGPAAYFATVPVADVVNTVNAAQAENGLDDITAMPACVSLSAGSFVCNHTAYAVSHQLATLRAATNVPPFVFVHVPSWRPDDGFPALQAITQTLHRLLDALTNAPALPKDSFFNHQ